MELYNIVTPINAVSLTGELIVPVGATGLVIFAHGSGSGRHSPRNQYVAQVIRKAGIGTLLFDLLTPEEEAVDLQTRHLRFNIPLLAHRLAVATSWVKKQPTLSHLNIGYFGASTGAGAALIAAAELGDQINAVVSRGGRPDLAGDALLRVVSPTLFIVGGLDRAVNRMNEEALAHLQCEKEMRLITGARHLFEEPGQLEEVATLTTQWFQKHL